jgi:hypothetical protein
MSPSIRLPQFSPRRPATAARKQTMLFAHRRFPIESGVSSAADLIISPGYQLGLIYPFRGGRRQSEGRANHGAASDYTSSVTLPPWLADPATGYVAPLSQNASVYDYIAHDGQRNIGSWIDRAAQGAPSCSERPRWVSRRAQSILRALNVQRCAGRFGVIVRKQDFRLSRPSNNHVPTVEPH